MVYFLIRWGAGARATDSDADQAERNDKIDKRTGDILGGAVRESDAEAIGGGHGYNVSAAQRERLDRCLFEYGYWRGHEAPREVREAYERRCAVGLNWSASPHAP
ncbi:hypothetical protein [Candidatus Viadribacter manganicus]|nr:hypothetical protein [Candidatus Viadribacter manganicus]